MGNKKKKKEIVTDKYQIDLYGWTNPEKFMWLITWLFKKAKAFCLIEFPNRETHKKIDDFLIKMKPYFISCNYVNKWPGMCYGGSHGRSGNYDYATQYCFRCNDITRKIFLKHVQSFEELRMPNMFEDLSFYSSDGEVIFYSVIHEDMKYIVNLEKSDVDFLRKHITVPDSAISKDEKDYI